MDTFHQIRGTVSRIIDGKIKMGDRMIDHCFSHIFVNTHMGELELVCSAEQIREGDLEKLKPGVTVYAGAWLSADVAVEDYRHGMTLNEENNLSLVQYSMVSGDPERLRSALASDVIYRSDVSKTVCCGAEAVILRFGYVQAHASVKYLIKKGTLVSVDEGDEDPLYGPGCRCLILYAGSEDSQESLCFIENNEEGFIRSIFITGSSRYHFRKDEPPVLV